jgi:hypothetical protein
MSEASQALHPRQSQDSYSQSNNPKSLPGRPHAPQEGRSADHRAQISSVSPPQHWHLQGVKCERVMVPAWIQVEGVNSKLNANRLTLFCSRATCADDHRAELGLGWRLRIWSSEGAFLYSLSSSFSFPARDWKTTVVSACQVSEATASRMSSASHISKNNRPGMIAFEVGFDNHRVEVWKCLPLPLRFDNRVRTGLARKVSISNSSSSASQWIVL